LHFERYILSHDVAQKVAGHELRNCSTYFQAAVRGLHVPLMCLIDFAGFRLVASSVLPISHATLCLGTSNGGKTINVRNKTSKTSTQPNPLEQASDRQMYRLLKEAGQFLNLKEHTVGRTVLPMAADLEGHYSSTDRRHYLVDFSRALPPDVTSLRHHEFVFARLLRPELVMRNPVPLNPDAFSGFKVEKPKDECFLCSSCFC
jgi:hypothetical protein